MVQRAPSAPARYRCRASSCWSPSCSLASHAVERTLPLQPSAGLGSWNSFVLVTAMLGAVTSLVTLMYSCRWAGGGHSHVCAVLGMPLECTSLECYWHAAC